MKQCRVSCRSLSSGCVGGVMEHDSNSRQFNTLDAQRESGEAFIKCQAHEDWVCSPERYDDGGFTGTLELKAIDQNREPKINCASVERCIGDAEKLIESGGGGMSI